MPFMGDRLSTLYQDLLSGSYDCVDRIVLNAYFRMGHNPGGFRLWWRQLTGSDATLDNAHVMRLAGRFGRRIRGYAKANDIPVVNCSTGERKHDIAEDYLARTTITQGLFLVLVARAQAPVWDVSANHHIEKKKPMPYVNHYSFHILDAEWGHIVVGGIDLNKPRMRWVAEAVIALSAASDGFTASDLAARVRALGQQTLAQYGPTRAAYDLKKFRGQ